MKFLKSLLVGIVVLTLCGAVGCGSENGDEDTQLTTPSAISVPEKII